MFWECIHIVIVGQDMSRFLIFDLWRQYTFAFNSYQTFFHLSAEELLSEPWVLLHTKRWHLRPLPVVYHTKRAGEGNAKDEPLQNWHWSGLQPQGKTRDPLFCLCVSHATCVLLVCSVVWLFPLPLTAQSAQHSEVRNIPGPGEGAGVWYRHDRLWWCQELLQVKQFSRLFSPCLPLFIAFHWDDSKLYSVLQIFVLNAGPWWPSQFVSWIEPFEVCFLWILFTYLFISMQLLFIDIWVCLIFFF